MNRQLFLLTIIFLVGQVTLEDVKKYVENQGKK